MEPLIQYAKTADGVNIAYWTLGEGMPLVHLPFNVSHIQMEWEYPEWREWYQRLAEGRMLVRYDFRGQGLSDRDRQDYSIEALVQELEAVVDRLEVRQVALLGLGLTGPVAIAYAARHPDRVSHLLLWCSVASPSAWAENPVVQSSRAILDKELDHIHRDHGEYVSWMVSRRTCTALRRACTRSDYA